MQTESFIENCALTNFNLQQDVFYGDNSDQIMFDWATDLFGEWDVLMRLSQDAHKYLRYGGVVLSLLNFQIP